MYALVNVGWIKDRRGGVSRRLSRPDALRSVGLVLSVVVLAALLVASSAAVVVASPAALGFDKYEGLSGQDPASAGIKDFQIVAKTAPSYGNLTVTIDGVTQTVSLYSSATTYKKIVLTKFVAPGTHAVKISRAGTKSSSSSGYTVDLDAISLYGVIG